MMDLSKSTIVKKQQPIEPKIKLIEKINNYVSEHGKPFFSLEFFPPRNETELTTFWPLLDMLRKGNPLFMDITWHSRTSLDPNNLCSSLAIATSTLNKFNHETVLHLTCADYDVKTMESILNSAKTLGIRNILALRGDLPIPKDNEIKHSNGTTADVSNHSNNVLKEISNPVIDVPKNVMDSVSNDTNGTTKDVLKIVSDDICDNITDNSANLIATLDEKPDDLKSDQSVEPCKLHDTFTCALDLVKFIKSKYDDYFTIGIAGYPMGHPEALSYTDDLNYLKSKVDEGAHFIVTQLSFSADQYISFIKDCRKIGIKIPIIPGIFPIQTNASIRNISKLTKVEPPDNVKKAIGDCKGDVQKIKEYGIKHCVDLCNELINSDVDIPGFHFYTLNRDNCVTEILKQLNLWNPRSVEQIKEPIVVNEIQSQPLILPKEKQTTI